MNTEAVYQVAVGQLQLLQPAVLLQQAGQVHASPPDLITRQPEREQAAVTLRGEEGLYLTDRNNVRAPFKLMQLQTGSTKPCGADGFLLPLVEPSDLQLEKIRARHRGSCLTCVHL